MNCFYGVCGRSATHFIVRSGNSRRSGPVCPLHARACAARYPEDPKPHRITMSIRPEVERWIARNRAWLAVRCEQP